MSECKKDLKYWKNNCEEDYLTTPISVLRYISKLEEQLTIPSVSKRFIELTREDLVKFKSYLPIDKISCYDFKSSSITRDEIHKAEKITFKDGEEIKILKSRY